MKSFKIVGIIVLLTILQVIAMMITTQIIQLGPELALSPEEASQAAPFLLFTSLVNSCLIFYFFRKTKNNDYKLIFWFICVWFGLGTFLPQTDTWYFIDAFSLLDNTLVLKIVGMGFINSIIVLPISFFIISSVSNEKIDLQLGNVLHLNIFKYLLFISIIYIIIYYLAGYFIAWQFDAIRLHYSGTLEKLSFFEHTGRLIQGDPYFFPFQIIRGILWFIIGIPLFQRFSNNKKECVIYSFFLYALLPTIQLFLPNPVMSEAVRMGHFVEGFISNGIFGVIAALTWQRYESQLSHESE